MAGSSSFEAGKVKEGAGPFGLLTVAHPLLATAKDTLLSAVNNAPPGSIVMVFGPTGVGKTTLRLKIQHLLSEQTREAMETDWERMPFASIEAAAPDNGAFSWRDYYRRLLMAMAEPMLDHKVKPDPRCRPLVPPLTSNRGTATELRHAVESAILHRRPSVVMIDEAQHLTRMVSGRKLMDQLDVIKSLANCTGTTHVLLGTYELLVLRHLSGQLGRRTVDVHFRRYRGNDPADMHIFKNVVATFQNHLPLPEESDLVSLWEFLYEGSVGCIGILKEWLQRALILALDEKCSSLTEHHVESTALSAAQCEKIAIEAHEGEAQIECSNEPRSRLRALLGLSAVGKISTPVTHPGHRRPLMVG